MEVNKYDRRAGVAYALLYDTSFRIIRSIRSLRTRGNTCRVYTKIRYHNGASQPVIPHPAVLRTAFRESNPNSTASESYLSTTLVPYVQRSANTHLGAKTAPLMASVNFIAIQDHRRDRKVKTQADLYVQLRTPSKLADFSGKSSPF